MRKIVAIVAIMLMCMCVPIVLAGQAGKSPVYHIDMVSKDSTDWSVVDGAWGKFTWNSKNGNYVFNGHDLVPETSYELINYLDPWNGVGSISLGIAVADEDGNVHIMGNIEGLMKYDYPANADGNYQDVTGAKIWLVLDADFDGNMLAWNPDAYVFETELIQ